MLPNLRLSFLRAVKCAYTQLQNPSRGLVLFLVKHMFELLNLCDVSHHSLSKFKRFESLTFVDKYASTSAP